MRAEHPLPAKVVIVPGYGDATRYVEYLTRGWPKRYGLRPIIQPFGTVDHPGSYNRHWQEFEESLLASQATAVIGISFGGSVALRALQEYPEDIKKVVTIAAPHTLEDLDPEKVRVKYPMLVESLTCLSMQAINPSDIMTIRPFWDGVFKSRKAEIEGATNLVLPVAGHTIGIVAALALRSAQIARFINQS